MNSLRVQRCTGTMTQLIKGTQQEQTTGFLPSSWPRSSTRRLGTRAWHRGIPLLLDAVAPLRRGWRVPFIGALICNVTWARMSAQGKSQRIISSNEIVYAHAPMILCLSTCIHRLDGMSPVCISDRLSTAVLQLLEANPLYVCSYVCMYV